METLNIKQNSSVENSPDELKTALKEIDKAWLDSFDAFMTAYRIHTDQ